MIDWMAWTLCLEFSKRRRFVHNGSGRGHNVYSANTFGIGAMGMAFRPSRV